jgi:hypothetical protein
MKLLFIFKLSGIGRLYVTMSVKQPRLARPALQSAGSPERASGMSNSLVENFSVIATHERHAKRLDGYAAQSFSHPYSEPTLNLAMNLPRR